jgi:hypothetical protein
VLIALHAFLINLAFKLLVLLVYLVHLLRLGVDNPFSVISLTLEMLILFLDITSLALALVFANEL